ncbi:exlusion protein FxsA [Roseovarius sp. 22II1-1F6A]|nr:exlusion protein FxsA [Roseovarius sp. 22II1-1F6A]
MRLFLLFLIVPLIEIALFVQVGGLIGLWPTLAIVILTAILGTALVKQQGRSELARLRGSFSDLRDPTEPLANGAMILFSGALLLTPGFFTDAVGFALLVPGVRRRVFDLIRRNISIQRFEMGGTAQRGGPHPGGPQRARPGQVDVIDGDYQEVDPPEIKPRDPDAPPSGWSRH